MATVHGMIEADHTMGLQHDRILVSTCDKKGIRRLKRIRRRLFAPISPAPSPSDEFSVGCRVKKPSRKALVISRCKSKSIPRDALRGGDGVTELTINNSPELETLPESIGDLTNLQFLDISGLPNIKRAIPLSVENCTRLKKIWAIDTPLHKAIPSMMTLLMPCNPMVVTDYGISNDEWPRLKQAALTLLEGEVKKQFGDDYDVYPYLEQLLDDLRNAQ
jgi:hypothetical protein